jgi:GT2 family glycosyltransferase
VDSAASKPGKFSVVIPTCNRPDLLDRCLCRLAPAARKGDAFVCQVIVSDDQGPQSLSKQLLSAKYPWLQWTEGPRRGPAANRNHGAKFAFGEWLFFCDDDCLPDVDILETYARAQKSHPDRRVFEGRIMADREKRHPLEEAPINDKGGNLWSCNFVIQRRLFEEIGGFDERFPFAAVEDTEFRVRLQKGGERIVFLSDAVVVHPWRKLSARGYLIQQGRQRRSHLLMMTLHPDYRSYFSAWNVAKDVARYYIRHFIRDLKTFGGSTLLFQPLFLWTQVRRIVSYTLWRAPLIQPH